MSVEVTAVQHRDNEQGVLNAYVDKKMISGNSGGPVVDDNNRVIGIACRGTTARNANDTGYIFLPIQEMRRCLEQFELTNRDDEA